MQTPTGATTDTSPRTPHAGFNAVADQAAYEAHLDERMRHIANQVINSHDIIIGDARVRRVIDADKKANKWKAAAVVVGTVAVSAGASYLVARSVTKPFRNRTMPNTPGTPGNTAATGHR